MASGGGGGSVGVVIGNSGNNNSAPEVYGSVGVVIVNSGNNNSAPEVYGSITVKITLPSGIQPPPYTLFNKGRDQAVRVPVNTETIPLDMNYVSAPPRSWFKVNANLWDANKERPRDHQIVNGSVSFVAKEIGADSDNIRAVAAAGDVNVDVTWSKHAG